MKLIAIEEHFLTREVREAWAACPVADDPTQSAHRGEIGDRLDDLGDERLRLMDEAGVDVQVLSLTTPGLHNLDSREGVALARRTNDLVAAIVAGQPQRFQGFAALPTMASREAPRELERSVRDLGLRGAMLCGRTRDKNLDHEDFWPIFECAERLGAPLFIHPQIPQRAVREAYYSGFDDEIDLAFASYGLGWHYEAGIQFVRLALAGVFDRFPELQIILGHWGEVVLFFAERLASLNRAARLDRPFRRLHPPEPLCHRERDVQSGLSATLRRDRWHGPSPVLNRLSLPIPAWARGAPLLGAVSSERSGQGEVCARQLGAANKPGRRSALTWRLDAPAGRAVRSSVKPFALARVLTTCALDGNVPTDGSSF